MASQRHLFLQHCAQTSQEPMGIEVARAEGVKLWDVNGKEYIDLIAGISVNNAGHRHPLIIKAIKEQLDKYSYLMVYGEYLHQPMVDLAKYLSDNLPKTLDSTFFVNSGSEAIEGALKLAKRWTGRSNILAFNNAYHGATHGAMSLGGSYERKQAFAPFLPGVYNVEYNNKESLNKLNDSFAAVVVELVQAESGIYPISQDFLEALKAKCAEHDILIIFDEVQTGIGRTGKRFAFEYFNVVPDILVLAKGLGGGMPIGCFISDKKKMQSFTENPVLGHITTYGGHPICCAAALANLKVLFDGNIIIKVKEKEQLFRAQLKHTKIKALRSFGLMMAVQFESTDINMKVIHACLERGLITDWFLYADDCLRIAPPLTISKGEIKKACQIILRSIDAVYTNS